MSLVHEASCQCVRSELGLFRVPETSSEIESTRYVEYQPLSTITQDAPIRFHITAIPSGFKQYRYAIHGSGIIPGGG